MSNKRPILIVDDSPEILSALRQMLRDDYRLVFATSGESALHAVAKHNPCLILLDVQMPDMDGYGVCRKLKASPQTQHIPVIFITALSDVGNEALGFEVGAVDYISKPFSAPIVKARVQNQLSMVRGALLERSHRQAIYMLGVAGHFKDNDTGVHIWRMAAYSALLARARGWEEETCQLLELAAPMHDTGKLGIPDSILLKPGKLTPSEWEIMKTHARIGYEILHRNDAPVFELAAQVALRHHEKWNGSGYPDGLAGADIPEAARIVAVADVFDALTMRRSYKEPYSVQQAMEILEQGAGTHFEPELIQLFTSILPEVITIKEAWDQKQPNVALQQSIEKLSTACPPLTTQARLPHSDLELLHKHPELVGHAGQLTGIRAGLHG